MRPAIAAFIVAFATGALSKDAAAEAFEADKALSVEVVDTLTTWMRAGEVMAVNPTLTITATVDGPVTVKDCPCTITKV